MEEPISFWNHIEELRKALIRVLLIVAFGMFCSFLFYKPIFSLLTYPFHHSGENLVILSPSEGLVIVLKFSFWVGLVGTSPVWMFFIFSYIAPALYSHERKLIFPFFFFSLFFLTLGFLFAFFITIPTANEYLKAFNQGLGINLWTLSHYLDYTLILLLANALAFEIFAILLLLVHYGWLSAKKMTVNRKFVLVGFLVLSALLTPPDVLTQIMLTLPLMVFYEATILYARLRQRKYFAKNTGKKKEAQIAKKEACDHLK
ncbi:MAG: twin-arginine translocase subunit TatC [bacterium]